MLWVATVTRPFSTFPKGLPPHPTLGHLVDDYAAHLAPKGDKGRISKTAKGTKYVFPRKKAP